MDKKVRINELIKAIFGTEDGGAVCTIQSSNDSPSAAHTPTPQKCAAALRQQPQFAADFYSRAFADDPLASDEFDAACRWFFSMPVSLLRKQRARFGGHVALIVNNNFKGAPGAAPDPSRAA